MRMIPKIRVSPTPRKNSRAACDRALTLWVTRNDANDTAVQPGASIRVRHLIAGRRGLVAGEGGDDLRYRIGEPLGFHQLDHGAVLYCLMIAFADRDMALD